MGREPERGAVQEKCLLSPALLHSEWRREFPGLYARFASRNHQDARDGSPSLPEGRREEVPFSETTAYQWESVLDLQTTPKSLGHSEASM